MNPKLKYAKTRYVKSPTRGTPHSAGLDFYVPELNRKFYDDVMAKNPTLLWTSPGYTNPEGFGKPGPAAKVDNDHPIVMVLKPQQRVLIPSGIHIDLDTLADLSSAGLALIAHNKSGVASKHGLDRLAEVVDQDYQGEIHINVVNTGNDNIFIAPGDKLIQFLIIPVIYADPEEILFENLYKKESIRGAGGFGSTDKNASKKV